MGGDCGLPDRRVAVLSCAAGTDPLPGSPCEGARQCRTGIHHSGDGEELVCRRAEGVSPRAGRQSQHAGGRSVRPPSRVRQNGARLYVDGRHAEHRAYPAETRSKGQQRKRLRFLRDRRQLYPAYAALLFGLCTGCHGDDRAAFRPGLCGKFGRLVEKGRKKSVRKLFVFG